MSLARGAGALVWVAFACGAGALLWSAAAPLGPAPVAAAADPVAEPGAQAIEPEPAESVAGAVVAADLFRADRRPAAVAYQATTAVAAAAGPAPTPPQPSLALTGLVWGVVPEAIVTGLPGTDGPRVLRVGDLVAGLRLVRLTPTTAVIVGADTLWTLTLRNPWP